MKFSIPFWTGLKVAAFILGLLPFLLLIFDTFNDRLGANPIEYLHFRLGDWALRFLCLTLAMTPLKNFFHHSGFIRFRRMLGLYAFFYATLHLLVYLVLDLSLSWEALLDEVPKSPYILIGFLTYFLLLPLAVTSNVYWQKRLGPRWKRLHRMIYIAVLTGFLHYVLMVKAYNNELFMYAGVIFILLGHRLYLFVKKSWKKFPLSFNNPDI